MWELAEVKGDEGTEQQPASKKRKVGKQRQAAAAVPPERQAKVERCRHAPMHALQQRWSELAGTLGTVVGPYYGDEADNGRILASALQLMAEQGAVFTVAEVVYLDPTFANQLLRPLVDHRLLEGGDGNRVPQELMKYAIEQAQHSSAQAQLDYDRLQTEYESLRRSAIDFTSTKAILAIPLLRFLWREADPTGDNTEAHAKMLCDAGVLFPLEGAPGAAEGDGPGYIMPMGLDPSPSRDLEGAWPEALPLGETEVCARCSWEAYVPPGLVERAIASLLGLASDGEHLHCAYRIYWARGALVKVWSEAAPPAAAAAASSSTAPLPPPAVAAEAFLLLMLEDADGRHVLRVSARSRMADAAAFLMSLVRRVAGGAPRDSHTALDNPAALLAPLLSEVSLEDWCDWHIETMLRVEPMADDETSPASIGSRCPKYARALRFVQSIEGGELERFLNMSAEGICFCDCGEAKRQRGDDGDSYPRGTRKACRLCRANKARLGPAALTACATKCAMYAVPKGWHRFAVKQGYDAATALKLWGVSHRKFHGTNVEALRSIFSGAKLARPGARVFGEGGSVRRLEVQEDHIQEDEAGVRTNDHNGLREFFDPKQVYFSSTIKFSQKYTYAPTTAWTDTDGTRWLAQVVLWLLVQPGEYTVGQSTTGACHCPVVADRDAECYSPMDSISDSQIIGLLVRLLPAR